MLDFVRTLRLTQCFFICTTNTTHLNDMYGKQLGLLTHFSHSNQHIHPLKVSSKLLGPFYLCTKICVFLFLIKLWKNKWPRRASLLPIIYFMGNRILLSNFIVRMAAKAIFDCLQFYYQRQWTKVEPRSDSCSDHPLYTKVPFVRLDPADWTVPDNNQRVLNVVFQRSPFIIVVGWKVKTQSDTFYHFWVIPFKCPILGMPEFPS